jgi:hypothetical protein
MQPEDLLATLLEPCVPSAAVRRDAALVASGEPAGEVAAAKQVAVAVAMGEPRQAPPSELRARVLTSAGRGGRFGRYADRVARLFGMTGEAAAQLLSSLEDPASFGPSFLPGLGMVKVTAATAPQGMAAILRLEPSTRFPRHAHVGGAETMLVLAGGLREEGAGDGEVWRGDEITRPDGSAHSLVALEGEPCIVATVVQGSIDLAR